MVQGGRAISGGTVRRQPGANFGNGMLPGADVILGSAYGVPRGIAAR